MSALPPDPPARRGAVSASAAAARDTAVHDTAGHGGSGRDPFSPGLQKLAASSGILAALLLLIAFLVNTSEVPDFNAPAAEYADYTREEGDALKLAGFVLVLCAFALVFYAGIIRSALGEGEWRSRGFVRLGYIVLGGFSLAATCFALGGAMQAAWGASGESEPEIQKVYATLSGASFGASVVGLAAALDAAGFIILRTRVFPAWLGWVALAGALFWLLTTGYLLDVDDDESIFGIGFPLGFLMLFIFLIATSIILIGRVGRESPDRRGL